MNKEETAELVSRRTLRSKLSIAMSKTDAHKGTGFNREAVLDAIIPVIARELSHLAALEAESEGDGFYGAGAHAVTTAFITALEVPTRPARQKPWKTVGVQEETTK